MVITNVPFGSKASRGENRLLDKAYQNESLENYFILRSLEKLKPGGLALFVTPSAVVTGKKAANNKLRELTSLKAEFLGAYRLPNDVFMQTGADVTTDIVVFKKHSSDAIQTIADLYEAGDIEALRAANVLWDDYISGRYFKEAGKKFVLGDIVEAKDRYGKLTERVVNTKPTADIMKMVRKFGDSRIDWDALNAAEPKIIEYQNGDTIFQNGKQLTYDDGIWREVQKEATDTDLAMQKLLANMGNAYDLTVTDVTWEQAQEVVSYCQNTGQRDLIPESVMQLINKAKASRDRAIGWRSIVTAKAIEEAILDHGYGYDYKNNMAELTKRLKTAFLDGKNSKLIGNAGQAHKLIALHYNKGKYSRAWLGDVDVEIKSDNAANLYENQIAKMQYENKSLYLTFDQIKKLNPDADPMNDDNWFVDHTGTKAISADDYLVGRLQDKLIDIKSKLNHAANDEVKAKMIRQMEIARQAAHRIDFKTMTYDLRSPLIAVEDKIRFMQANLHKDSYIIYDENGVGRPDIIVKGSQAKTDEGKLYNRIGDWFKKGTITLAKISFDRMTEREALEWLANKINVANVQFDAWVRSQPKLLAELDRRGNADKNLYFNQTGDDTPIDIAGLKPSLKLHPYQCEFVRKQGRFFGGINGMGVGLGKTFSALASVQHVQNIGAKKKTIFVVPNSVLSNWRKEASAAYQDVSDCLFIGLRETDDSFKVYSNKYDEDLVESIAGKYRKIFMTYEAFKRIRLKEDTIENYARYIRDVDSAYTHKELQKSDEAANSMVATLVDAINIESNAPFLEDMNVDSIVVDEAHAFKNSISAPNTDSQVKYLSIASPSGRGEAAQAKLWYVRNKSGLGDGVQLLTATPITNSPLEIYSMLSLASGREAANSLAGGVKGADEFIQVMCHITEEVVPTIDGGERSQNVFTGLKNVQILRHAISTTATIKDAGDVGLSVVIPERDEVATKVTLPKDISDKLSVFQRAYKMAQAIVNDKPEAKLPPEHPDSPFNPHSPYQTVKKMFGESDELMAHPFNLMRKMDVMIADDDFSLRVTFYDFSEDQIDIAEATISKFNKKGFKDDRKYTSDYTDWDDVTEIYRKDGDGPKKLTGYKVIVKAGIYANNGRQRIVIDTLNSKVQDSFERMAEKAGLKLNVTTSPKVAAMLENFKNELANPRGIKSDGTTHKLVKQIIFCDHLFLHNKLKRLLAEQAGVSASKIAIITGQTNNEPDEMIDIQDGFNAMDDENQYQVIIANEKAEVGINLQQGTQAIHHLTTGWTPDSLEQRNGRGARQGNRTDKVAIYYYDADGTFDEFKRTMINKKDEWITSVLKDDGKTTVAVSGGISKQEQDVLITSMGDQEAIAKYQAEKEKNEAKARSENSRKRQLISIELIESQQKIIDSLNAESLWEKDLVNAIGMIRDNLNNLKNSQKSDRKAETVKNDIKKYEIAKSKTIELLARAVEASEMIGSTNRLSSVTERKPFNKTADELYDLIEFKSTDFKPSESYRWAQELKNATSSSGFRLTIKEDQTSYHKECEALKEDARRLIEASGESIDKEAKEFGGLPVGAGEKIAKGTAKLRGDIYLEVGSFVVEHKDDGSNGALVGVIAKNFQSVRLDERGKVVNSSMQIGSLHDIVYAGDDRYLHYVKEAAKIEDNYYAQAILDDAMFSDYVPEVAEYRNKDTVPNWPIPKELSSGIHKRISGCALPLVLPTVFLDSDTPLSNKLLAEYKACGINVDLDASTFIVDKGAAAEVVANNNIRFYADNEQILDAIISFMSANNLKIGAKDGSFSDLRPLVERLLKTADNIDELVDNMIDPSVELTEDIEDQIITKVFDEHLYNSDYFDGVVFNIDFKDTVLGSKLTTPSLSIFKKAAADHIAVRHMIKRKAYQRQQLMSSLKDDDAVLITGNTYPWRDVIKDGAKESNIPINAKGDFYKFDKKLVGWIISYKAYKDIIANNDNVDRAINLERKADDL
ncbi:MAG: DEAD/DEAH box helicase [Psychrobacter sp.]|nr:DEAD/DEAH box helicase [Psychrobacter sp.]